METNSLLMRLLLVAEELSIKILSFDMTGPEPTAILETKRGIITVAYNHRSI